MLISVALLKSKYKKESLHTRKCGIAAMTIGYKCFRQT